MEIARVEIYSEFNTSQRSTFIRSIPPGLIDLSYPSLRLKLHAIFSHFVLYDRVTYLWDCIATVDSVLIVYLVARERDRQSVHR